MSEKKYQIFVSSVNKSLKAERKKAIEVILKAGYIPTGMEFFETGQAKEEAIYQEIDESDAVLLILGYEYGSYVESGSISYTEAEYRYAKSTGKKVRAIVLKEECFPGETIDKAQNNFISCVEKDICQEIKSKEMFESAIYDALNGINERIYKKNGGWERNQFTYFDSIDEADNYLSGMIKNVKKEILDLNWNDIFVNLGSKRVESERLANQKKFTDVLEEVEKDFNLYQIFTFPKEKKSEHFEKLKKRIKRDNYYAYYYKTEKGHEFPKLNFTIVDGAVIFLSSKYNGYLCATTNKAIVNLMKIYFREACGQAIQLKNGKECDEKKLRELEDYLDIKGLADDILSELR